MSMNMHTCKPLLIFLFEYLVYLDIAAGFFKALPMGYPRFWFGTQSGLVSSSSCAGWPDKKAISIFSKKFLRVKTHSLYLLRNANYRFWLNLTAFRLNFIWEPWHIVLVFCEKVLQHFLYADIWLGQVLSILGFWKIWDLGCLQNLNDSWTPNSLSSCTLYLILSPI